MQQGFFIPKLILLVFTASLAIGCSSSPTASSYKSAAAAESVSYQPKKDSGNFGISARKISGKYNGIYFCKNQAIRFEIDLKADKDGALSGSMQRRNLVTGRGYPGTDAVSESSIDGRYLAASSTLYFRVLTANGQKHNPHHNRSPSLEGIMLPDASAFVMYDTHHTSLRCSAWVAQRGDSFPDEWEFLKKEAEPNKKPGFFARFGIKRERSKDYSKNSCDPKLLGWLKGAAQILPRSSLLNTAQIRTLYRDKYFVPHFGKPFLQLDTAERIIANIRLTGSCARYLQKAGVIDNETRYKINMLTRSFANKSTVPDVEKAISLIGFDLADAWLRLGKAHLGYMVERQTNPENGNTFLASFKIMTDRMLPKDREAFLNYAGMQIEKMLIPKLTRDLDSQLAELTVSFDALDVLANFEALSKQQYPSVDSQQLQPLLNKSHNKVNQTALAAAKQYAQAARQMEGTQLLDDWQQQYKHLASVLNERNKNQIKTLFVQRRTQIASEILRDEKRAFQQAVVQLGNTPAALSAGKQYDAKIYYQYKILSNEPGYAEFTRDRQTLRKKILAASHKQMANILMQAKHARTLVETRDMYLLPADKDQPAGKKIYAAYQKRLAELTPFGEGKFELYLSALYTYDYKLLRAIDRNSAAPAAISMISMMPAMKSMAAIIGGLSGGAIPAQKILEMEQKKLEQMSLIYPTMAFYVLNYEKYHPQCIERNAVPMTVKYRWTESKVIGGIRHEIDSGGHDTSYKVNKRFLPAFNIIYKGDGDNAVAKFADRFFSGNNKIYRDELVDGTYQLMQKNCKGKLIKAIEPQMIRYFNDVKSRMDAITSEAFR